MRLEAFLIIVGLFLAIASLVRMRDESAAGRRVRRTSRRPVGARSRRKIVAAAPGR